jgi:hypothetical protein
MTLRAYRADGTEVRPGDTVTSFRGEDHVFKRATRAPDAGRTGKVETSAGEYYQGVYSLTVRDEPDVTDAQRQAEDKAWTDAYRINWPGAVNTAAIARTLGEDIALLTRHLGTSKASRHPAVLAIFGQLAFLMGKSLGPEIEELDAVADNARRLGIWVEGL